MWLLSKRINNNQIVLYFQISGYLSELRIFFLSRKAQVSEFMLLTWYLGAKHSLVAVSICRMNPWYVCVDPAIVTDNTG